MQLFPVAIMVNREERMASINPKLSWLERGASVNIPWFYRLQGRSEIPQCAGPNPALFRELDPRVFSSRNDGFTEV
jgi:hypothetical protein